MSEENSGDIHRAEDWHREALQSFLRLQQEERMLRADLELEQ